YLQPGDTIGMVCPSGFMPKEKMQTCIDTLINWGYRILPGKTLGSQYNYFSGTDKERTDDLQSMMDNKKVKAIFCARGGYGLGRIIDNLDFKKFIKHPKWIIGFSDITVLESHLFAQYKIASLHAPMAAAFNDGGFENKYVQSLREAIMGRKGNYNVDGHMLNKNGHCKGKLVGGNLSLLVNLIETPSQIKMKNKILFIEDVGEYIYNVDRMLYQLKRSGQLAHLRGLIIGRFSDMKDTTVPFGEDTFAAINDIIKEYDYPVCYNFPVSHDDENYALKIGVKYELTVSRTMVELVEK
ncbi:MAG: S66 peptidase family protein, partial [Ginsengibacter sp.]